MKHSTSTQQGIALIEGLIAILIFSLGILSLVGLQAFNLKQATDAKYRADASFLADQTLGRMWADRNNLSSYVVTDQAIDTLPNGKRTVTVTGKEVVVKITWKVPGDSATHKHVVLTHISG